MTIFNYKTRGEKPNNRRATSNDVSEGGSFNYIFIGITGSYASGKTFILDYLAKLGYQTFSADLCVKELYKDLNIQAQILKLLPELQTFEREKIIKLIYEDDKARLKLQNFIYPLVIEKLLLFKQSSINSDIIFAEIPLLFEADFDKYFDFVVTVFCSEATRIKRAKMRGSFDLKIYKKIEQIQLSQKEKILKADFSINAHDDMVKLEKQIQQLITQIKCSN